MSVRADICQILGKESHNTLLCKRNFQKEKCGPGGDWQRFKQLPDQTMFVQKFGRKLVKPLRIEKTGMGKRKTKARQRSKNERNLLYRSRWRRVKEILKDARRKLEKPVGPTMPCKRQSSFTKVVAKPKTASEKNSNTIYFCTVESHESTRQRAEYRGPKTKKITLQVKDLLRCLITIWCTSSSRCHKQWKIPDAKAAVEKMEKLEKIPAWDLGNVKSKKEVILEAQRDKKESPLCCTGGYMSPQKMRSWNPSYRSFKGRVVFRRRTLLKTTLDPMQFLLNRARLRPRWLLQK